VRRKINVRGQGRGSVAASVGRGGRQSDGFFRLLWGALMITVGSNWDFSMTVVDWTVLAAVAVTETAAKTAGTGRDSGDARRLGWVGKRLRKMMVQLRGGSSRSRLIKVYYR
jgi:hypothetical protein